MKTGQSNMMIGTIRTLSRTGPKEKDAAKERKERTAGRKAGSVTRKEKEKASSASEASEKVSPEAEQDATAPGQKKFDNFEVIPVTANCLVNAGPRSPRSGKISTVKAILGRGVVLEPHEGASGLVKGTACYQDNLVYLDEWP